MWLNSVYKRINEMFSFYRQFSLLLVAFRRLKFFIDGLQILLHLFLDCILFRPSRLKAHIFFMWYQTILSDMAALTSRRQLRDSPKIHELSRYSAYTSRSHTSVAKSFSLSFSQRYVYWPTENSSKILFQKIIFAFFSWVASCFTNF